MKIIRCTFTGGLKPFLVSQTLKRFESQFSHFVRISKSTMVNPNDADKLIQENAKVGYVKLTNGLCLLISRRRLGETLARLGSI